MTIVLVRRVYSADGGCMGCPPEYKETALGVADKDEAEAILDSKFSRKHGIWYIDRYNYTH